MKLNFLWIGVLSLCFASAEAVNYYVSPAVNDAGAGTSVQPFRTIQKAANVVNPGDSVIVRDGVYTLNPSIPSYVGSGLVNYGTHDVVISNNNIHDLGPETRASIYSLSGKKVASIGNIGPAGVTWNIGRYPEGVYLVHVQSGIEIQTTKVYCGR